MAILLCPLLQLQKTQTPPPPQKKNPTNKLNKKSVDTPVKCTSRGGEGIVMLFVTKCITAKYFVGKIFIIKADA